MTEALLQARIEKLRPESREFLLAYTEQPVRRISVPDSVWGGQDSFLVNFTALGVRISEAGWVIAAKIRGADCPRSDD